VQTTKLLAPDAVERRSRRAALSTLCDRIDVPSLWVATAACRDAKNGKAFGDEAERMPHQIEVTR